MDPATSIPPSSIWGSLNSWFTSTVFFILLNLMIATILLTSNLPNNNHHHQEQQQEEDQQKQKQKQKQDSQNQPQIARSPSILHRLKSFNFLPQIDDDNQNHEREPLHIAATQYVFNQPLHYQHFDFDFDSTVSDQTHLVETVNTHFEFDPTRQDNNRDSGFDFHTIRNENDKDGSFDFDPTREEIRGDTELDFDPTHEDEHADEFESLDEVYSKLKAGGHHDRTKSDCEIRQKPTTKFKKSASLKVGFSHLDEEKTVEARRPETVRERKTVGKSAAADDDVEVDSKADDFINRFKNDLKLQRIESILKSKGGKK